MGNKIKMVMGHYTPEEIAAIGNRYVINAERSAESGFSISAVEENLDKAKAYGVIDDNRAQRILQKGIENNIAYYENMFRQRLSETSIKDGKMDCVGVNFVEDRLNYLCYAHIRKLGGDPSKVCKNRLREEVIGYCLVK